MLFSVIKKRLEFSNQGVRIYKVIKTLLFYKILTYRSIEYIIVLIRIFLILIQVYTLYFYITIINNLKQFIMKKNLLVLSVLILIGLSVTPTRAYCEDHVITFTVTDSSDDPIPFATIVIEDSDVGVCTDIDGKATFRIPGDYWDEDLEIKISALGYIAVIYTWVDLNGRTHIDVVLQESPPLLRLYQKFIELF